MLSLATFTRVQRVLPISLVLLSAPALAQSEVWVDPVIGSNFATGLSSSEPWRTLTYAFETVPSGATVHMQPGLYSGASGETFPLVIDRPLSLVGEGAAEDVVIDAPGIATGGFRLLQVNVSIGQRVALTGFTVDGRNQEMNVLWVQRGDCLVTDVHLFRGNTGFQSRLGSSLVIERCTAEDFSFVGARAFDSPMTIRDSTFTDCDFAGVAVLHTFAFNESELSLERCRIVDNSGDGVFLRSPNGTFDGPVDISDSLIARNGGSGIVNVGLVGHRMTVSGSTIVGNGVDGIFSDALPFLAATISGSIVSNNGAADVVGSLFSDTTLAGDGSLGLMNGNLSGDPRFVDRVNEDYRLRFDSPCIDTTLGATTANFDLTGRLRAVDGNLDMVPAPDMGALEHQTLSGPASASIGETITLFTSGPIGGFSSVGVSYGGYAPGGGTATVFGRLFLNPAGAFRLVPIMTTGSLSTPVTLQFPMDPALIGTSTGFQALTRSTNSASGAGFSNPILVSID